MYRICKIFEIQAAHLLSKHPGKCKYPHGHSYRIEVVLESEQLDQNDMVCDFSALKICTEELLARLDHGLALNSADPNLKNVAKATDRLLEFENQDPTSEVLARWIFQGLQDRLVHRPSVKNSDGSSFALNPAAKLKSVRIWETSTCWAQYSQ